MLRVFLCDDNATILEKYKTLLTKIKNKYNIPMRLHTFQSGKALLFHMDEGNESAEIIYLDIIMDNENGIDVAKKLRDQNCQAEIIFLTANPEFVFDSFEATPSNYILKDQISEERFEEIFLKTAIKAEKKSQEILVCSNGSTHKSIPFNAISHFEISNRITTVHYDKESFAFYQKLEDLEKELGHRSFIRVHRSFLVNMNFIEELTKNSILLSDGTTIPLGGTYIKNVKKCLNEFYNYIL